MLAYFSPAARAARLAAELVRLQAPAIGALLPMSATDRLALQVLSRTVVGPAWARRWEVTGKVWKASTLGWQTLDDIETLDVRYFARRDTATQAVTPQQMFERACVVDPRIFETNDPYAEFYQDDLEEEEALMGQTNPGL